MKKEITDEERQAKYILEPERLVRSICNFEEKHGWMGVMAVFQHWFKKPVRGNFDWYLKENLPKKGIEGMTEKEALEVVSFCRSNYISPEEWATALAVLRVAVERLEWIDGLREKQDRISKEPK